MNTLFDTIEKYKEKYTEFWKDICLFETNSRNKKRINELNDFIEKFALADGLSCKRYSFENAGDYLIIDTNSEAEKGFLLIAHTDTVFEDGVFGDPAVKISGDKMYGPGVIDCKGGIAMAFLMMRSLSDIGYDKNIRLILVSDEEVDNALSNGGIDVIKENARGYKGAFCLEVGKHGEALVGRKGILRYKITVHGKAAHSGIDYFNGINSIYEASKKIIALQESSRRDGATYSCNIIEAGTVMNIVPDKCSFFVDIRFKNYEEKSEAERVVEQVSSTDYIGGTSCEAVKISSRDPFVFTDANLELFKKVKSIADEFGLEELSPAENGGGSDAAYVGAVGVPTICGIGATGDFCHTVKEYANIDSLAKRAKILATLICREN